MITILLKVGLFVCLGTAVLCFSYVLADTKVPVSPQLGRRGLRRSAALKKSDLFRFIEPFMRVVAGWVASLPIQKLRKRVDVQLATTGDWLGLTADEFLAVNLFVGVLCIIATGYAYVHGGEIVANLGLLVFLFPFLVVLSVFTSLEKRFKARGLRVARALPAAMDLVHMCMTAGLDFPRSIAEVVRHSRKDEPLVEELDFMLQELALGHSRQYVLLSFADRVPVEAVRDFVYTVVQSEAKGTPLVDVLSNQADTLRTRRSMLAEQALVRSTMTLSVVQLALGGVQFAVLIMPVLMIGQSMTNTIIK